MRPPISSCLPRPNRLPCTNSRPNDLLLAENEPVGTGAQGNLSFTEMFTRTPVLYCSHQTFTSENRPVVLRRARTVSSVSISSVSPIDTPAAVRTVDSSVRWFPITRTSVISSPMASAGAAARTTPRATANPTRGARAEGARRRRFVEHKRPREIRRRISRGQRRRWADVVSAMWSLSRVRARNRLDQGAAGRQVLFGHVTKTWRELLHRHGGVQLRGLAADEREP